MTQQFYSYRKGRQAPLDGPFFTAFVAVLNRLIDASTFNYFPHYLQSNEINHRPAERRLEELIASGWTPRSLSEFGKRPKSEASILDTVEGYWQLALNRPLYEAEVNLLFSRFNQPFAIAEGLVKRHGSEVLEKIFGSEIKSSDQALVKYIERAVEDFFYSKEDKRLEGLRSLYDAYERLKSSLKADKSDSTRTLIRLLVPAPLEEPFNKMFGALTSIGNEANIRHSELRVSLIDHDPDLVEFLFYTLYSLIRTALHKLNAASPLQESEPDSLEKDI